MVRAHSALVCKGRPQNPRDSSRARGASLPPLASDAVLMLSLPEGSRTSAHLSRALTAHSRTARRHPSRPR